MVVISERVEELLGGCSQQLGLFGKYPMQRQRPDSAAFISSLSDSETVGADLMSVALEPGAGAVLPETRLAARVVGVGAERRGCPGGCTLCNNSKQVSWDFLA